MTVVRIPNLPVGAMVNSDGEPTDEEGTFRNTLITSLQQNFGPEGVVIPSQKTTDITIIQNNQSPNGQYTCNAGTFIYDSTTNEVKVAVFVAGVPTFKVVQVV